MENYLVGIAREIFTNQRAFLPKTDLQHQVGEGKETKEPNQTQMRSSC